jgi:hypothetical protein
MAEKLHEPSLIVSPLKLIAAISLTLLFACNSGEQGQATPSPGVVKSSGESVQDSSGLISDSVTVPDSNTADIESMKKIN